MEFVTLGVLLLVPVVYLVLCVGRLQAGAFAVEGAAREAARVIASGEDVVVAESDARAAVALALADQGFEDVDPAEVLEVRCEATPCRTPEAVVTTRVQLDVVLPGVPAVVAAVVPARVPVTASGVAVVERFGG